MSSTNLFKKNGIKILIGLLILLVSWYASSLLKNGKKKKEKEVPKIAKTVFVKEIYNAPTPLNITTTGVSMAKNRVEIYSEVQGVLQKNNKAFKEGQYYKKGQVFVRANNNTQYEQVQSIKSKLYNLIVASLPDLKADFPQAFSKWEQYIYNFDFDRAVAKMPKPSSDKEKFFINSRNILTTYYELKTQQEQLNKYVITAPFDGILIESNINQGSLIRPNQKLGVFIDPSVYEIEISVNQSLAKSMEIGRKVALSTVDGTSLDSGKIIRINGSVDRDTQTTSIFVESRDTQLKEGIYLNVSINAKEEENATTISRELLDDGNKIFAVKNDKLIYIPVEVVFFDKQTAVVKGIPDGTQIITKMVPGAYEGMLIKQ